MGFTGTRVDLEAAQQMLNDGKPVLQVAQSQSVSPQRVYQLIRDGLLHRTSQPATAG